jgi:deoxyribodipyrimidine photo-lyase
MSYELVWFKRDLRWEDHAALTHASRKGTVRCIYIIEPDLWLQPDSALQHFEFVRESLQALDRHLRAQGGCIEIFTGELPDVLQQIWQDAPFANLYSHEETGNAFTYARDLKVASWCQSQAVTWHEFPQFGVVRGLKNRNLWQSAWERHMSAPICTPVNLRFWQAPPQAAMVMQAPPHLKHNPPRRQRGGDPWPRQPSIALSMLAALAIVAAFLRHCLRQMHAQGFPLTWLGVASACEKWCSTLERNWLLCRRKPADTKRA